MMAMSAGDRAEEDQARRRPPRRKTGPAKRQSAAREGTPDSNDGPPLEVALRRLEEIAGQLESGELDLETSLRLYREARELHGACVRRLTAAEREVRILTETGADAESALANESVEKPEAE
jgi:exodeoxyribonuclease VII small subunit